MTTRRDAECWLPVNVVASAGGSTVRWMDFGSDPLAEPFFALTVRKLRKGEPPARERTTDLEALTTAAHRLAPLNPAGVILHVSRCGSTLVSNALRTGHGVTILSEARPIGVLTRSGRPNRSQRGVDNQDELRGNLLHCISRLYGRRTAHGESKLVIKCHAAGMLQINWLRSVWPDTPFLVLIRDPVEVMVSNLAKAANWLKVRERPMAAASLFGWEPSEVQSMSEEEFCARGLGRFCESVHGMLGDRCRVIDYEHLDVWSLYSIAEFFNIAVPPCSARLIQEGLSVYAKDPERRRPFEDDRERKQRAATDAVRQAAARWAVGPYRALRAVEWDSLARPARTN
jgi:hypothetical protein